jgi:hypothetical protein
MAVSPRTPSRGSQITSPGDERSTQVLSGEITRERQPFEEEAATREAVRAWPRTDSPQLCAEEFGTYYVYEELGVGGMATVHRAERRVNGTRQRVALKRLLPAAAHDPDLVELFLDEAQLASLLHHRNIAEIYECGRVGDEYFLAMELVAGPTLKALLKHCQNTVGLIPYPIALNLLVQICEALAYAHDVVDDTGKRLELVHRDVSPSNIVISSNGVVKLIDFGIAKTASTNTQAGIIKGKLGYIAPEYLEGGIDRRADLWAVGVVAYELLTNKRLFTGDDDLELIRQVKSQPIVPPSLHNPDVPPELDAIVMTALRRDPARRWQNAAAMRNALVGAGRPSSYAETVEWVEWVYTLAEGAPRPVRGTKPQPMMSQSAIEAALQVAPSVHWVAQAPVEEGEGPVYSPAVPIDDTPLPLPMPLVTSSPVAVPAHYFPLPAPRHTSDVPAVAPARRYMPTIGAAMIARRRPRRRFLAPLVLFVLGGAASAFGVPRLYETLFGG